MKYHTTLHHVFLMGGGVILVSWVEFGTLLSCCPRCDLLRFDHHMKPSGKREFRAAILTACSVTLNTSAQVRDAVHKGNYSFRGGHRGQGGLCWQKHIRGGHKGIGRLMVKAHQRSGRGVQPPPKGFVCTFGAKPFFSNETALRGE